MNTPTLLTRAIPLSVEILEGLQSGELTLSGGTVRDLSGRIVKHLIFPSAGQTASDQAVPSAGTVAGQLSGEGLLLSMVNILSARQVSDTLVKQLEGIGKKMDELDQKSALILQTAQFSQLLQTSELISQARVAIEEAIYANQTQDDPRFIRLHVMPLRRAFSDLDTLVSRLLVELANKQLIENLHFTMLLAELKNKAAFVLGQTHIQLNEDNMARHYFEQNIASNNALRERLAAMKQQGVFNPHIISREDVDILKKDIAAFKVNEAQAALLANQNSLALALDMPQKSLLDNELTEVKMLD